MGVVCYGVGEQRGWLRWLAWATVGLIAVLLIAPLGRFVETTSDWLEYPYPRSGTEGLTLYESLIVKRGGNIYDPITPDRFISAPYPPVYYLLAAAVLPDKPPDFSSPGNITSLFQPGRLISFLAALLTALLIPLLVVLDGRYNSRRRRLILPATAGGIIAGWLWLTLPPVLVWSLVFRSDMLMIGFTAAGLVCIAAAGNSTKQAVEEPPARRRSLLTAQSSALTLGAFFFALAFFTKQTAFAGPLAAGVYLLLGDWKLGLKWCALMAAFVIVPFAALDLATGHWFYLKLVDYHSLPVRFSILTRLLHTSFWDDQWPLIVLAVPYALYGVFKWLKTRSKAEDRLSLIPIFLLASFAGLPTGGVVGADHNHLLVPGLAVCAAVGALLAGLVSKIEQERLRSWKTVWPLPAMMVLIYAYLIFTSAPSSAYDVNLEVPTPEYQEQMRLIIANVSQHPAQVFFSDSAGILALAGKQTPYDDPFTMNILSQQGRWDEAGLRNMLREGRFGLLVLSCDVINTSRTCQFTPGVLDAIRDGYKVVFKDILFTYAPK